jgi:hypothetical protein
MSSLDIFNLDPESLLSKSKPQGESSPDFYKPYPKEGKEGVYEALIRFVPNPYSPENSKIRKYYNYLKDPSTGKGFSVDCPSTVYKKSVLQDLFWKLFNSTSAADKELAKSFSRKEDYYSLIQIVEDKNKPELEGKILIYKFPKKINDLIEAQLKPKYGAAINPYDVFGGKEFALHVRTVGDWNNYDLCSFVGEKVPMRINGKPVSKTPEDMTKINEYLKSGPNNLTSFGYKEWDAETTDRVMEMIRTIIPDGRVINEIVSKVSSASSSYKERPASHEPTQEYTPSKSSGSSSTSDDLYSEITNTMVTPDKGSSQTSTPSSPSSLEDLYADL